MRVLNENHNENNKDSSKYIDLNCEVLKVANPYFFYKIDDVTYTKQIAHIHSVSGSDLVFKYSTEYNKVDTQESISIC